MSDEVPSPRRGSDRPRPSAAPLWKQAATGVGLLTLGALTAVLVGVVMAAVVSWLF